MLSTRATVSTTPPIRPRRRSHRSTRIRKTYGDRTLLADVSLLVRPGCLHGLLGPERAGKTTLMRVMLGLIQADAGSVRLLGTPVPPRPIRSRRCRRLRRDARFLSVSVRPPESVALARLDGGPSSSPARVEQALEQVGLGPRADAAVSGYSAGMRQRLGLAAALLRSPRVLLLDEPTSSLDPGGARDVRALVKGLTERGVAVVLSSHDMAEVEALCDELTVINHGQVVYSGSVEALRRRAPAALHFLHSSDDHAAHALGTGRHGVTGGPRLPRGRSRARGRRRRVDAYTIALGQAAIAVRSLERRTRS